MSLGAAAVRAALSEVLETGRSAGTFTAAVAAVDAPGREHAVVAVGHLSGERSPQERVGVGTMFDLASLTKVSVAVLVHRLVDGGLLTLDSPVRDQVATMADAPWAVASPAQLLSHRGGLPAESAVWRRPELSDAERLARVLRVEPDAAPGARHRYSCLGYVALGAVAEQVTGQPLPALVEEYVARPVGASSLRYGPVDPGSVAATEIEPHRGPDALRGVVHDELAHSLGGRVGNAGLFGTADDVVALGRALAGRSAGHSAAGLNDGHGGPPLLSADLITRMATPVGSEPGSHGLGLQVDAPRFMGDGSSSSRVGHTGFTGTSLVVERSTGAVAVLLTNRVHPRRTDVAAIDAVRRRVADIAFGGRTAARGRSGSR